MNLTPNTQNIQGLLADMFYNLVNHGIQDRNVSQYRYVASDCILGRQEIQNELIDGLFFTVEALYIQNKINLNNDNSIFAAVDDYLNLAVPYVVISYSGMTGIPPEDNSVLRSDATRYAQMRDANIRFLQSHYSRMHNGFHGNRGYMAQNGFGQSAGGYAYNGAANTYGVGGYANPYDRNRQHEPVNNSFDGSHVGTRSMFADSEHQTHRVSKMVSPYDKARMNNEQQNKPSKPNVSYNDLFITEEELNNKQAYNEIVDDDEYSVDAQIEIPAHPATERRGAIFGKNSPPVRKPSINDTPKNVSTHSRKRGVYWFKHTVKGVLEDGNPMEVTYDLNRHAERFLHIREQFAPREYYPINVEDLKWAGSDAYIEVPIEGGDIVREYVYTNNPSNPVWKTWDKENYRCVIELNGEFLPVQKFILLTEEEKMDIEKHRIPGKRVMEGIATTAIPYRQQEGSLENQIDSLVLSKEEFEKQEQQIKERGDEIQDYHAVRKGEIIVDDECDLVKTVLEKVYEDTESPKLVEVPYINLETTFTKRRRQGLIDSISKCSTINEFKETVFDKLVEHKEYVLANKLSRLLDHQYNKLLVRMGLTSFDVRDAVLDHNVVLETQIHESCYKEYHSLVSKMLKNLVFDNMSLISDPEEESPAYVGSDGTVFFINRLASELNIILPPNGIQVQKWVQVTKHARSEFFDLCRNVLLRKVREDKMGRDIFFLTADGVLIEVMSQADLSIEHIYVSYKNLVN